MNNKGSPDKMQRSSSRKSVGLRQQSSLLEKKDSKAEQMQTPLLDKDYSEQYSAYSQAEPDSPKTVQASATTRGNPRAYPEAKNQVQDETADPSMIRESVQTATPELQKLEMKKVAEIKDVPNNTDRPIDFSAQMEDLKRRTEAIFPYTNTITEDAMYLDMQTVCTLEYHLYQNDCQYVELKQYDESIDEDGILADPYGNPIHHHLYTQSYQPPDADLKPMDNFPRESLTNFYETKEDFLKSQKSLKRPELMRVEPQVKKEENPQDQLKKAKKKTLALLQKRTGIKTNMDDVHMVEPIIATYRVNLYGKMIRLNETPVKMGRKFFQAKNGNMTLIRSTDKRCISLINFEHDNKDGEFFKLLAWTIKLVPFKIPESVNASLSEYYRMNFESFDSLVEVRLVCNCKMVMLNYIEVKVRSLEEQQDYELEIDQQAQLKSGREKNRSDREQQQFAKRKDPRKAPKWAFFDLETGDLVFEYGGVHAPEIITNQNGEDVEAFVVGLGVKEIREESFDPKLILYVAGDFLSKDVKKQQLIHDWAWVRVSIGLYDIAMKKDPLQRLKYINDCLRDEIPKESDEKCNYYLFPSKWILQQRYNWEMGISCGANRRFDQVIMINQPINKTQSNPTSVMINGPKFRIINRKFNPNLPLEVPYFVKAPDDAHLSHGRNIIIKDCIFYKQSIGNETRTICCRLNEVDESKKCVNSGIGIMDIISQYDTWLHQYQKVNQNGREIFDIFQTISVSKKDQSAVLQTRMTVKRGGAIVPDDDIFVRYTKQFYQNSADLPFIAYNLGSQKIILQSAMKPTVKKAYVINLPEDQRFLGFVDFNSFVDIGFYPKNLKIECCSHFLYLTTSRNEERNNQTTHLNLLLADPFPEEIKVAIFQSKGYITQGYFKQCDQQIRSCIQANMVRKLDLKFGIYLWTQFPGNITRSKIVLSSTQIDSDPEDMTTFQQPGEQDVDLDDQPEMLPNPMIQDSKDFIYYVQQIHGICKIYEGNPRDPYERNHQVIFEIKADRCFAFTQNKAGGFYFMDNTYTTYCLERYQNNRNLQISSIFQIKEIQRLDFIYQGLRNDGVILAQKYSIMENKIFYLYDDELGPYPEGIMESEDLIPADRTKASIDWYKGPYEIRGSNRVYNVYNTEKFKSFIKIISKPDANERVIVNDFMNSVDFSTFLPDGKILLKVNQRFMMFAPEGAFIQEIQFNDDGPKDDTVSEEEEKNLIRKGYMTRAKFLRSRKEDEPIPTLDILRKGKPTILNFLGLPFRFLPRPTPPTVDQNNKMELIQMSSNCRYYLFVNLLSCKLLLYELCEMGVVAKGSESCITGMPDILAGKSSHWELQKVAELKTERSTMFQHMYIINVDPIQFFRENKQLIDVDDDGKVKLTYVENLPQIQGHEDGDSDPDEDGEQILCRITGAFFHPQDNGESLAECFMQQVEFPLVAKINLKKIVEKKILNIEQKIQAERTKQCRLPPKLFDYGYYETLIEKLDALELKKIDNIYSKIVNENLLIIWSGSILKYTRIKSNKGFFASKTAPPKDMNEDLKLEKSGVGSNYLKNINMTLDPGVEIIKVMETLEDGVIQIIAFNHDRNVIQIITWDFINNNEKNQLQISFNEENDVGYNVIKGMNQKRNFLIEKSYLTDLEYNIPLWQSNVDQGLSNSRNYGKQQWCIDNINQVKLFQDNSRFLGIEKASCLYYQNTRLNTKLWQSINSIGERLSDIEQACSLDSFNLVFDGCSLFHYFAPYPETIDLFHQMYIKAKQNNDLVGTQATLPLQILNPDLQGRSALYLSLQSQSPKSFECMVDLLKGIDDRTITKMMLKSLAVMLSHESIEVVNFFESAIYQPPLMREELFVPWDDNMTKFVFPCHTSVITRPQLLEKLSTIAGIKIPPNAIKKTKKVQNNQGDKKEIIMKKKNLKKYVLEEKFDTGLAEGEEPLKRVRVEALDFDWIFDGDNAKVLLRVLANDANDFALTQRSVKIFIDLMWSYYQKAIITYIFIPYIVYMLSFINLSANLASDGLDNIVTKPTEADKIQDQADTVKQIWWNIALCMTLFIFYAQQEIKSMIANGPIDHFSDIWNTIDAICLTSVFIFLVLMGITCYKDDPVFGVVKIRTIGGFAVFFMWIKLTMSTLSSRQSRTFQASCSCVSSSYAPLLTSSTF